MILRPALPASGPVFRGTPGLFRAWRRLDKPGSRANHAGTWTDPSQGPWAE